MITNVNDVTDNVAMFDEQLEKELLGYIILNNKNFEHIENDTGVELFYFDTHQRIFIAIKKLLEDDRKADVNTIFYTISTSENIADTQLKTYINELVDFAATSISTPKEILGNIHFLFLRRQLYDISGYIKDSARDSTLIDIEAKINDVEEKIYTIANSSSPKHDIKFLGDYTKILREKLDTARKSNKDITGLKTNLIDFDHYTGGLQNSDLIIIAARPSMGKTAFAVTMAVNIAKSFKQHNETKESVAIFSLEMSGEQLSARIVGMESGFSTKAVHTGRYNDGDMINKKIDDQEFHQIVSVCNEVSKLPLFIDDTPGLNLATLKSRVRYLKRRYNISTIIIDYLQLLHASRSSANGNRVLEIAEITQTLKAIAKELHIPVIALSQLSRAVEARDEKRPQLSDLRESGTIEQDADIVMFLYREAYYHERDEKKVFDETDAVQVEKRKKWEEKHEKIKNLAEVIIAKNRNGPIGSITLHFNRELMKFENHIPNEAVSMEQVVNKGNTGKYVDKEKIPTNGFAIAAQTDEIDEDLRKMFKK